MRVDLSSAIDFSAVVGTRSTVKPSSSKIAATSNRRGESPATKLTLRAGELAGLANGYDGMEATTAPAPVAKKVRRVTRMGWTLSYPSVLSRHNSQCRIPWIPLASRSLFCSGNGCSYERQNKRDGDCAVSLLDQGKPLVLATYYSGRPGLRSNRRRLERESQRELNGARRP